MPSKNKRALFIRKYPDPILRKKAKKIKHFDEKIEELANTLKEIMYENKGIGLAASQVGVLKSIVVINLETESRKHLVLINPSIRKKGPYILGEEGCLSLPNITGIVPRAYIVEVEAQDTKGEKFFFEAEGFLARVIQHEVDHLFGILFIDYLSEEERRALLTG